MMTSELASQIADALLHSPNSSTTGSADDQLDDKTLLALAEVALQMLVSFSPEKLLSNFIATVSSPPLHHPTPRLRTPLLASCVLVWGSASPSIKSLISAYCLPALDSIAISIRSSPFGIGCSVYDNSLLCARVLPRETASAIEVLLKEHASMSHSVSVGTCVDEEDPHNAWSCLYRCICATIEHAAPADLSPILSSVSLLLPLIVRLGPGLSLSTVSSFGDVLHMALQQVGDSDSGAGVRMCKQSLKQCLLPPTSFTCFHSFDIEQTRVILQVCDRCFPQLRLLHL
jgi:hypothetical protein